MRRSHRLFIKLIQNSLVGISFIELIQKSFVRLSSFFQVCGSKRIESLNSLALKQFSSLLNHSFQLPVLDPFIAKDIE